MMKNTTRKNIFDVVKFSLFGLCLTALFACGEPDSGKTSGGATEETQGIAINDKVVAGVSQKGPFVNGSAVHLYGLNFKNLNQSGSIYTGKITNDKGEFKFSGIDVPSQYVLLEADGYYRNEVSGEKSKGPITLYALTDLSDREKVNINLLTHLEYERALYLAQNGMSVRKAKIQAEQEILESFYINSEVTNFEDLNIFNDGEGDAALLAISVLLQGNRSEADLSELLANYAQDIEEDGTWDDEDVKADVADWAEEQILNETAVCDADSWIEEKYGNVYCNKYVYYKNGLVKIRQIVEKWNFGNVPSFEKHVVNFWLENYGLGQCNKKRQGEVVKNQNKNSRNKNVYYTCDDESWRRSKIYEELDCNKSRQDTVVMEDYKKYFACKDGHWVEASEIEGESGVCNVKNEGRVVIMEDYERYEYDYYLCRDNGWNIVSEVNGLASRMYGVCSDSMKDSVVYVEARNHDGYDLRFYAICKNNEWQSSTKEAYENGACNESKKDSVVKVVESSKDGFYDAYYICQDNEWKRTNQVTYEKGLCDESKQESVAKFGGSYYICQDNEWKETTELIFEFGVCNESKKDSLANYGDKYYYICQDNEWKRTNQVTYEKGLCDESKQESVAKSGGSYYICQDNEWKETTGLIFEFGVCNESKKDSVVKVVESSKDGFYDAYYICQDNEWKRTNQVTYENGVCNESKKDSVVKSGGSYYVCQGNEWKETTELIFEFGVCNESKQDSLANYGDKYKYYYICQNNEWKETTELIFEFGVCNESKQDSMANYDDKYYYICQNNEWTETNQVTYEKGLCDESKQESVAKSGGSYYICQDNEWKETTELIFEFGVCNESKQDSMAKVGGSNGGLAGGFGTSYSYYICQNSEWIETNQLTYENGVCNELKKDSVAKVSVSGGFGTGGFGTGGFGGWGVNNKYYICQENEWKETNLIVYENGVCNEEKQDLIVNDQYVCRDGEWKTVEK